MKRILIVDDDIYIGDMMEEVLKREGYAVSRAYSGTEAVLVLSGSKPDLIVLDLMLPGLSGEEVLSKIKGIPVIVVSAKLGVDDKVSVLLGGAADYITKPFDIKEFVARVAVQLRGDAAKAQETLSFSDIELCADTRSVTVANKELRLTRTEYAILKTLLLNRAQVVTKSALLDRIGSETPDCTESSLKIHISNLRKKLRDAGGKDYIEAVWGIGFKLKTE